MNSQPQSASAREQIRNEIDEIAVEACIYAYPMVLMDITRQVAINPDDGSGPARMNQFINTLTFPDATFTHVVRPNVDTLYSTLWFDVTEEPLIIEVPNSDDRYYLLQMLDMWSDVFASPGQRTTGTEEQTFAIVGPGWEGELPKDVAPVRSPTAIGWILGRTQTDGTADYEDVNDFQRALKATPLSAWRMNPPVDYVNGMDAALYFEQFMELIKNNPPHPNDFPILAQMQRIGLRPGQPFDFAELSVDVQHALTNGKDKALAEITKGPAGSSPMMNGWAMMPPPIGTYGTAYLRRAQVAYTGLGANVPEDAIYPTINADEAGNQLDPAQKYKLTFSNGKLPPANAFWSLTMYNEKQLFGDNEQYKDKFGENCYAIGDHDDNKKLILDDDDSLTIYIQRDLPDAGQEANWLPIPTHAKDRFSMNLRLYWPKPNATNGDWVPPAVKCLSK